jgi:predicted DsbA family dithiol-disulfide isomerase
MTLQIEIFSDVVCPWCYIGKRRLDRLIARGEVADVEIRWRAFQLYPGLPVEGMDRAEFVAARGGSRGAREQLLEEAADVGISMNFERIGRMPNTFAAHRLLHLAASRFGASTQHQLAEALFAAYFVEGSDVGNPDVLRIVAATVGIPGEVSASYLAGPEGTAAVNAELERSRTAEITGVPCFVFGQAFALPGAQTEEVLAHFVERARNRLNEIASD